MEKEDNDEFEILKKKISQELAPALLEKLDELGYHRCHYLDDNGAEFGVSREVVLAAIDRPGRFFQPHPNPYDSTEGERDRKHRLIINEFNNMKRTLKALIKRQQDVTSAIQWIDNIGDVHKRKVITEKS